MPCQQDEMYAAESAVPWGFELAEEAAQRFLDEARDRYPRWLEDFSMVARIEVVVDPGRKNSVGKFEEHKSAGLCCMAPAHSNPVCLCHEAAHVLVAARFGRNGHGPWFARVYLELVYSLVGSDAYAALKASFDEHGIDYDVSLD